MTEAEWLTGTDPTPMLELLRGQASDRKLRLFACALWLHNGYLSFPAAVVEEFRAAERYADEPGGEGAQAVSAPWLWDGAETGQAVAEQSVQRYEARWGCWGTDGWEAQWAVIRAPACRLLREVFGNPFRSVVLDAAWVTPTGTCLATAAYEERELPGGHLDGARLAVLADALEVAGCSDEAILDHLRGPGPHVRGCHVLDALLAKE